MSAQMNNGQIIDGKAFAFALREKVKAHVAQLSQKPGLAVVIVGEDAASKVYVAAKEKACIEVGMASYGYKLPQETSEADLLTLVEKLNQDPRVHGILVQLPLPKHIDEAKIIESISPAKDVDGFHAINQGKLMSGAKGLVPCTPLGCLLLLKSIHKDLSGLHALVIGRSNIVGKPMAMLLLNESCTVTIAHSRTRNLPELCRQADIVVAAVGRPRLVQGAWLKQGATVIDVGINRVEGKLVGDVDFASAQAQAAHITPVPGGVGPMTIACLMANTLTAYCLSKGAPAPDWN
jgi:methylenetetrahydrofolate dehydrogenase (NADP+) / methenyltetrahydrofolate cyclohydrolase